MNNLFSSVCLALASVDPTVMKNPLLIHGVMQKTGCGMPPIECPEEKKGKKLKAKARGTVKAEVLFGDPWSHNLIIASCYDQKPFYMLSK